MNQDLEAQLTPLKHEQLMNTTGILSSDEDEAKTLDGTDMAMPQQLLIQPQLLSGSVEINHHKP